ncbi:MAG TPA: PEP/pyruvate-binding domain-containing protein [Candidatus Polarisedimenticolia bacterium]|nr:PEP/pyruvate-binding domain-containing protein [Candidatus Polarisedimenticolia bacterium]
MGRVLPLWELRAEDLPEAGAKALGLARLVDLGVEVPDGFVITASFFEAARCIAPFEPEPEALARALTEDLSRDIASALEALGPSPGGYAVRSSAPEEDSRRASFAGIFESYLSVPAPGVTAAVFRCWASAFSERAVSYRRRMGLPDDEAGIRMAVVVQRMLAASAGGVLFTRDPAGDDAIVVQADRQRGSDGGAPATRRLPRDPELRASALRSAPVDPFPLEERPMSELVDLSLRLEAAWGIPLDLEWAFAEERLWFLQARPITAIRRIEATGPEARAVAEDTLWTRANLRELLPEIPSPLFASLTERIDWAALYSQLGVRVLPGDRPVRFIEGRPYFNLNLLARWMAQFGMPIGGFLKGLGHDHNNNDGWTGPPVHPVRAFIASPATLMRAAAAHFSAPRFLQRFFERSRAEAQRLARLEPAAWTDERLIEHLRLTDAAATDLLSHLVRAFNRVSVFQIMVESLLPAMENREGFLSAVLAAGERSVSATQGADLVALAAKARQDPRVTAYLAGADGDFTDFSRGLEGTPFLAAFGEYLREYGHRGIHESDPAMPLYREDPTFLMKAIARLAADAAPPDLEALAAGQESVASAAWGNLRSSQPAWERWFPVRWRALKTAVARLKAAIVLRERTRFEGMRVQAEIRRFFSEAADRMAHRGLLESPADLPYLRFEEIEQALLGGLAAAEVRACVALRRAEQERRRDIPMPNLLRESEIARLAERPPMPVSEARAFRGLPVGPGSVEGRVLVLDSPRRISEARRGDILVVPTLDPSWIPLFTLVSGLVVELGGTLSHGSIIAREYGLPTVANLPGITRILKTGERILLDGSSGTLRRLQP